MIEFGILAAVVFLGVFSQFGEELYRTWKVGQIGREFGFERRSSEGRLGPLGAEWYGIWRGYAVRLRVFEIFRDEPTSANPNLKRSSGKQGALYIAPAIRLDLPAVRELYVATVGTTKLERVEEMKTLDSFTDSGHPDFASFFALQRTALPVDPEFARRLADVLDDLQETYHIVRLEEGWLTVANQARDHDTIDVDLTNLTDVARRLGAPAASARQLEGGASGRP